MAKKKSKKSVTSSKRVTKKNTKVNRKREPQTGGSGSTRIMFLAIIGLVLLVYLASTLNVDTKVQIDIRKGGDIELIKGGDIELIDTSITISGKTYSSREVAREQLRFIPQSQLTNDERWFVEGYKE